MVELILIIISFIIIIYIICISKNSSSKKRFEEVLNESYKLDDRILSFELKRRDFIDNILIEFREDKKVDNNLNEESENYKSLNHEKIILFKSMLQDGYNEFKICKDLNIGRGEFLLLKKLYEK